MKVDKYLLFLKKITKLKARSWHDLPRNVITLHLGKEVK